jgi:gas vesicle protein
MGFFVGLAKFVAGGAIGAVIGAGVATILAPQSGDELQEKIRIRIEEGKAARAEAEERARRELEEEFRQKVGDPTAFRSTPGSGSSSGA